MSPHLSAAKTPGSGPGQGEQRQDRLYTGSVLCLTASKPNSPTLWYFALDGTGHASHRQGASMICRYIIWRNHHVYDERLRRIVDKGKRNLIRH